MAAGSAKGEKPDIVLVDDREAAAANYDLEKSPQVRIIDNFTVLGLSEEDARFYNSFTEKQRNHIIKKVDLRLVPMLAILYLISQLDRANIGNAKIEGLSEDLHLVGNQYNIVLALFFTPYILLEVPSNILLRKSRPSVYLGSLVTAWGIIMTLHGVVSNFGGLLAVRLLLGVFEAGFYPGAIYLCAFWYMPKELAVRIAYFYCTSALSGAFSGLLAAAIALMDGVGGYEGWRWIFLLEGIATTALGILCFFFLVDSPSLSCNWLCPEEIRFLELQSFVKQGGRFSVQNADKKFHWFEFKMVLTNWRLYLQAYILLCISACSYGTKFTLPSIVKAMGFTDNTIAQLMTVPAYVAGAISSIFFAYLSDRFLWRMPFIVVPMSLITIGYAVVMGFNGDLGGSHTGPGYLSSGRRAIGLAFCICMGNIGGIIGSFMYLDNEAPAYPTGFGLSLAFGASGVIAAIVLELSYIWANKEKSKIPEEVVRAQYTEDELLRLGDKSLLFKYLL
ncbi:MFS general substrate transporter [Trichoderma citrinoviride]|uniref:MFS general substrate transporter n=1 Tax=Trichoderma citrinoviride TaxID=58853 RepID=A0A2T4AY28_9HYPO|nr:MFS general substrate transporter [Trichoderma citrinoviride]PTB61871.1 MFS general substrate transporter [Trichoderma citrinoviride]